MLSPMCSKPCTSLAARAGMYRSVTTRTAAAATATAAGLVLRFIDLERASAHVLAVEILDGARCILARHFHEAEAARLSRVAILDQGDRLDRAVLREQRADGIFVGGKGQVAHIDLAHTITH